MQISDYNLYSRVKKEEMNKELEMDESLSAFVLLSFHCKQKQKLEISSKRRSVRQHWLSL